jgi:hypothetical protein
MSTLDAPIRDLQPTQVAPARSLGERAAVILAWGALTCVDLAIKTAGFERFHRLVQSWPRLGKPTADPRVIDLVCGAVNRAAIYYFKRAWCLQRSATTVCLLRLRGIEACLVIGAHKMPFYAHAWVEVAGRVVNDHPSVQERYTVLERC